MIDGVQRVHVGRVVELDAAEEFLRVQDTLFGEHGRVLLLVDLIVLFLHEPRNDPIDRVVLVDRSSDGPLMMSGVRASSMRMESTSSTMA